SDRWALGAIVYEALTGRLPYQDGSLDDTTGEDNLLEGLLRGEPPPPPSASNPTLPSGVDEVLLRALAFDGAARFATATEFIQALANAAQDAAVNLVSPVAPERNVSIALSAGAPSDRAPHGTPKPTTAGSGGAIAEPLSIAVAPKPATFAPTTS